jgi:DNA replication protein DnaC
MDEDGERRGKAGMGQHGSSVTSTSYRLYVQGRQTVTAADGISDRLLHNARRIEMRGDSMRKNRGKPNS